MNRAVFAAGALAAAALSVYVTYATVESSPAIPRANVPDSGLDGGDAGSSAPAVAASAPEPLPESDAGLTLPSLGNLDDASLGSLGFDSGVLVGGPRSVRFGVVLVTFAGAQGAGEKARTKAAAQELAQKLAEEAKTDFHAAVTHGDSGSADDMGRMQRGVLEAPSEAILFGLATGATSEAFETPRGFWIVKRLD